MTTTMHPQVIAIALGAILVGVILLASAIHQLRRGETRSNRGGPAGIITRDERPGTFWMLFWIRIALGPLAIVAGVIAIIHLQQNV